MNQQQGLSKLTILILFLILSFASVGAVIFTPGMPQIGMVFHGSEHMAQWTMLIFLLGYALGELPYGPISNRFTRRMAVQLGCVIAFIGVGLCLLSAVLHVFALLLVGLGITGFGAACGLGLALAMVSDSYDEQGAAKVNAILIPSFAMMPAVAVVIGGFLVHWFSWWSTFVAFGVYIVFIFLIAFYLPKTQKSENKHAINFKALCHAYGEQFSNWRLLVSSALVSCCSCAVYFYVTLAPFVGIGKLNLTTYNYGLLSLLPYTGMIIGSRFSIYLSGKIKPFWAIFSGAAIISVAATSMLLLFIFVSVNVYTLFIPSVFFFVGAAILFSNGAAKGFSFVKDKANASAVMNFINVLLPLIGVFVFSLLKTQSVLMLPIAVFGAMVLAFVLNLILLVAGQSANFRGLKNSVSK